MLAPMADAPDANPFRTLSSARVLDDPRCVVRRDEFAIEGGHRGTHVVIEIPPAVAVVPELADGRLLLLRQWRYALGARGWEVPAGRIHDGEFVERAAARELREETGYAARSLRPMGRFFPIAGISSHCGHLVAALGCEREGPPQPEPTERIEVVALEAGAVREMLASGAIEDGFAIAALTRYLLASR